MPTDTSARLVAVQSDDRQPIATVEPKAQIAPIELRLSGVVSAADRRASVALISVKNSTPALYRVGDSIDLSTVVIAIREDSIIYRRDGKDFQINVQLEADNTSGVAVQTLAPKVSGGGVNSSAEPVKYPGFIPSLPATKQADGTELPTGNAQFKRDLEKRFANRQ